MKNRAYWRYGLEREARFATSTRSEDLRRKRDDATRAPADRAGGSSRRLGSPELIDSPLGALRRDAQQSERPHGLCTPIVSGTVAEMKLTIPLALA